MALIQSTEFAFRPATLEPGDTVGIVAPASNVDPVALAKGCDALRQLGYKVIYDEAITSVDLYFAGSVERRTRELERMFEDPEVKAIVPRARVTAPNFLFRTCVSTSCCAIPRFSSAIAISLRCSPISPTTTLSRFTDPWPPKIGRTTTASISRSGVPFLAANSRSELVWRRRNSRARERQRRRRLYGGCLSMLAASLGTPYEQTRKGSCSPLKSSTKPYQVDRMLMQLKLAGKFEGFAVSSSGNERLLPARRTDLHNAGSHPCASSATWMYRSHMVFAVDTFRRQLLLPFGVGCPLTVNDHNVSFNINAATVPTRSTANRNGV